MKAVTAVFISIFAVQAAADSVSQIDVPELEDDVASSLQQGEKAVEKHESVLRTTNLQNKLSGLLQKGGFMQKRAAQAVAMSAGANLLSPPKVQSLLQTAADQSLNVAVKEAQKQASNRVTLEEVLAVETTAQDTMDSVSVELSEAFNQMKAKQQACQKCKNDCPLLQWQQYKVHTMAECQEHCKLMICKETAPTSYAQKVAEFQERTKEPHFAEPTKFSSYLQDYNKAHGLQDITVNNDDEFDIVWEQPREQENTADKHHADPVQELRKQDLPSKKQKTAEQVLKEVHQQVEEAKAEKLVKALA